jgi:CHAT domain-containing protein
MEQRFPDYASLLEPRAPGIADVQRLLRPGEVLLSVLVGQAHTYVWAVPHVGQASFAKTALTASQVARSVGQLRRRLDPGAIADASRIPAFDFTVSHALYRELLGPVEPALREARALIVVPHAELSTLPFAVLTTAPFTPAPDAAGFDGYADAPWLIKRHAVSQLPSATALLSLRREPVKAQWQRAFVGFGDPVFAPGATAGSGTRGFGLRSKAVADTAALDESKSFAAQLHRLQPLPETADEIREIGKSLGADERRDLFLRERATEANVKAADLTGYRVVMFATHGLVPGDLPGLSQPALALSNPALTGGREDGLLQMDEVLGLKLRAEWVVLSACNTASAAGAEEAISGLGRAFFFAGARALLVTHWPIETESARVLTTTVFRLQAQQPQLSRAKALQEASLEMMRSRPGSAPGGGYAHPIFWAPFVLVGEGG